MTFEIVDLDEQPYVGIRRTVTMRSLSEVADEIPRLVGWLARHALEPVGAPFLRYHVIDMAADLVVEAGVPVAVPPEPDDGVEVGSLPAGRYVAATHVGPYDGLEQATRELFEWADAQGLAFDVRASDAGDVWAARVEWYDTNPADHPDPATWTTRLTFKLADTQRPLPG